MELKDFVSETLKQVIEGVKDAQQFAVDNNASINPLKIMNKPTGLPPGSGAATVPTAYHQLQTIEFDVAITVIEGTETKGGAGVAIGVFTLGADGKSNAEKQSVSRIKFEVQVHLPPPPEDTTAINSESV